MQTTWLTEGVKHFKKKFFTKAKEKWKQAEKWCKFMGYPHVTRVLQGGCQYCPR